MRSGFLRLEGFASKAEVDAPRGPGPHAAKTEGSHVRLVQNGRRERKGGKRSSAASCIQVRFAGCSTNSRQEYQWPVPAHQEFAFRRKCTNAYERTCKDDVSLGSLRAAKAASYPQLRKSYIFWRSCPAGSLNIVVSGVFHCAGK
ncbi:hypothetical protein SAMN05444004_10438 [Jannaschia faecimaris]|uniref:Uncharacterized protein n=1 Tax=Jannaschia faecimaris TaxID=1244108 RepID=A0A1H3NPK3_9RHOB|nr:hypothetical protein SAMN05444004_10438 [Jannaschia faecimaris]